MTARQPSSGSAGSVSQELRGGPTTVVAWRTLELVEYRGGFSLSSHRSPVWPARRPLEAQCLRGRRHRAPSRTCTCGIYARPALADLTGAIDYPTGGPFVGPCVLAELELSGRVFRGPTSYRAQLARARRLMIRCVRCRQEPGNRTSPASVIWRQAEFKHGLQAACDEHRPGISVMDAVPIVAALLARYGCGPLIMPASQQASP